MTRLAPFAALVTMLLITEPAGPAASRAADCEAPDERLSGVDQSWLGPTGFCDSGTTGWLIQYVEPVGQQFTPTQPLLAAVDVLLTDLGSSLGGTDTLTLRIKKGTIDTPQIAAASARVTSQRQFWQHFSFDRPVAVVPGEIYVIELDATNDSFGWISVVGDGEGCTVPDYAGGHPITFGQEQPRQAFAFRTYAGLPPP